MNCFVVLSFFVAMAAASLPCNLEPRGYPYNFGGAEVIGSPTSIYPGSVLSESGFAPSAAIGNEFFINSGVPSVVESSPAFADAGCRKYKVALDNCGPKARRLSPVSAPTITTAPVQGPTVTLPYKVPKPRTVCNSCKCVKTIVKAQPIEQVIRVPIIRRYIQTLSRPKVETITYEAVPVNCPSIEGYSC